MIRSTVFTFVFFIATLALSGCGVGEQFGRLIAQQGEVATKLYNHGQWKAQVKIRRDNRVLGEVRVGFYLESVKDATVAELHSVTLATVKEVFNETPEKLIVEILDRPKAERT